MAAGPTHIVETTNTKAMIFTRGGALLSTTSLASFFSGTSGYSLTDPRILFDAPSGRFFLVVVGHTTTIGAWWIGVSTTSDPTGSWNTWQYIESGTFPDFPAIGINDDKFIVTDNGFSLPGLNTFRGTQVFVFNKADLTAGASQPHNVLAPLDPAHFTIQPAQSLTSTTTMYMASNDFPTSLTFWQVAGLPGVSTVTAATSTLAFQGTTTPPPALQLGSVRPIDTGDDRFLQAIWANGKLWISGDSGCIPSGDSTTRSCAHFVQVNTATPNVVQDFNFGLASFYYYYPAIALDSAGNLTTIFSRSSSSEAAGLRYTSRLASDPVNTLQSSVLLKTGNGAYDCSFCPTDNRWGDFFGAALDPSDTSKIWIAGEYAKVTTAPICSGCTVASQWGTYIAQVQVSPATCLAASLAPSVASPQVVGTTVTWTAGATGCTAPEFDIWMLPPGAGWRQVRDWSTTTTWAWDTTSLNEGSYTFEVHARQTGSNAAFEAYVDVTYRLTPPVVVSCTNAMLSPSLAAPQIIGVTVTWTASASGCTTPQFDIWMLPPVGGWGQVRDWSTTPTYVWDTTSADAGTYAFEVHARQSGSSAAYEAYLDVTYRLTVASPDVCTTAGLSPAPISPQTVGTAITWTASATGCGVPQFDVWMLPPAGGWELVRDWSTTPTFLWNTTGATPGAYTFEVHARRSGSSAAYEAYVDVPYNLTAVSAMPCASTALVPSIPPPQTAGVTVTWTASATQCTTPEFDIWMIPPGAGWRQVRGWSTAPTFAWNTTGAAAGSYVFEVHARSVGASAAYEAYADVAYALH